MTVFSFSGKQRHIAFQGSTVDSYRQDPAGVAVVPGSWLVKQKGSVGLLGASRPALQDAFRTLGVSKGGPSGHHRHDHQPPNRWYTANTAAQQRVARPTDTQPPPPTRAY